MKKVLLTITVPSGQYCWDKYGDRECCEHFNNEHFGHSTCTLGMTITDTPDGVLKDPKCSNLYDASRPI